MEEVTMTVKIGRQIKALRQRDDVTQDKLAEVLGVTSQAISKWENETGYPDIEYITPIANFFNVTIDELFCHDLAEKERKIKDYCEKYDEMHRNWAPVDERVNMMRQALAEYPGNEELLVRLAAALWEQWAGSGIGRYSEIDGKLVHDCEKVRTHRGWEEPVIIMEELLSTSVNDAIRNNCRDILSYLYGWLGEKEKVYKLAEYYCPECKNSVIFRAFNGIYDKEAREASQNILIGALSHLQDHLPLQTKNQSKKAEALTQIINLYKFIFDDGNFGFYHSQLNFCYCDYAEIMLQQNKANRALDAYEQAYEHAKQFDAYLDMLRINGKYGYTAEYADAREDKNTDVYAKKQVPELLNCILLNEKDIVFKKLNGNPRFEALVTRIKGERNG